MTKDYSTCMNTCNRKGELIIRLGEHRFLKEVNISFLLCVNSVPENL